MITFHSLDDGIDELTSDSYVADDVGLVAGCVKRDKKVLWLLVLDLWLLFLVSVRMKVVQDSVKTNIPSTFHPLTPSPFHAFTL